MKKFVAFLVTALVFSLPAFAGLHFKMKTISENPQGGSSQSIEEGWAAGSKFKVVFIEAANQMSKKGGYLLSNDGGTTLYMVDPEEKSYFKFDLDQMAGFAGAMGQMMNAKVTDAKIEKLLEEPGGMICGVPTTHYRYRTSYKQSIDMMGFKMSSSVVKEEDIWLAPKFAEAVVGIWMKRSAPKTGNKEFDDLVKLEMSKAQGVSMKRITVQSNTDGKGNTTTTKSTMEMTEVNVGPVPDSTFVIPPTYKEVQPMQPNQEEGENPFAKMLGGKKKG